MDIDKRQTILDWVRANQPDFMSQIEPILRSDPSDPRMPQDIRENVKYWMGFIMPAFDAGADFQRASPDMPEDVRTGDLIAYWLTDNGNPIKAALIRTTFDAGAQFPEESKPLTDIMEVAFRCGREYGRLNPDFGRSRPSM